MKVIRCIPIIKITATLLFIILMMGDCKPGKFQQTSKSDKFEKDIPVSNEVKGNYEYKMISKICKTTGLQILDRGFDSLAIRLWYMYSFDNRIQIIQIKNKKSNWKGEYISLEQNFDPNGVVLNTSKKTTPILHKINWKNFVDSITSLNILTLKASYLIPGYVSANDGNFVIVEIATTNKYRIYTYTDINYNAKAFWQAKNMTEIIKLIESQLGIKSIQNF